MERVNKNVIFPTDFSPESLNALDFSVDYAERSECKLILINVIEYPWKIIDPVSNLIAKDAYNIEEVIDTTRSMLENISAKIKKSHDISVSYVLDFGNVLKMIVKRASNEDTEVIILGTKPKNSPLSFLFEHHSYNIADKADVPVITISSDSEFKKINKILFPISDRFYTTKKLNEIIRMSKIYDSEVVLLGIASEEDESLDEMSFYMEHLLKKLDRQKIKTEIHMVINENYGEAILNYSEQNNIDMVAVVSNFDHSLKKLFITTPDEKLVKESKVPVLNIPVDEKDNCSSLQATEYISPWSMKYDSNKVFIPIKNS